MPGRFFSGVTFVLVCFVFHLYAFVEAAALRLIVLRYAGVPIATRVSFFLSFSFFCRLFGDVTFSEYFLRFLFVYEERVRRTFFPSGCCFFYLATTGWIFDISLCKNSINQSSQSNLLTPYYREQPQSTRIVVVYSRPAFSAKNGQMTLQPVLINKLGISYRKLSATRNILQ